MKLIKESLFEQKQEIEFINPELDYSEFFRLFNYFNKYLPNNKNTDKNKYYADLITKSINKILNKKYNLNNGLKILKILPSQYHENIKYFYSLFKNGYKINKPINWFKHVYFGEDYKENDQSFHHFIDDKNYDEKIKNNDLKQYYKKSFDWFDNNKIPIPVIIKIKNKYYLLGGNRRLSWLIKQNLKSIPIWLINVKES